MKPRLKLARTAKITMALTMAFILLLAIAMPMTVSAYSADRIQQLRREISQIESDIAQQRSWGEFGNLGLIAYWESRLVEKNARLRRYEDGGPNLQLLSPINISLLPGETQEITITLRNVGNREIRNLDTLAVPSAAAPFTVEFLRNTNRVSQIGVNTQRNMTLRITANENATPSPHTITLNHFFENHLGVSMTPSHTINVQIGGEVGAVAVEIINMTAPLAPVPVGQAATFGFYVHNTGDAVARNVQVQARVTREGVAVSSDAVTIPRNPIIITSLEPNEIRRVEFNLTPHTPAPVSRTYTVRFSATFDGFDGSNDYLTTFNVAAADVVDDTRQVEIRNLSAPTGNVRVGARGTVSFDVYNVSGTELRNIRVEAERPGVFLPMTAEIVEIASLAPGEGRSVSFTFSPTEAAITQNYMIHFNIVSAHGAELAPGHFASFFVYNPAEAPAGTQPFPRVMVAEHTLNPTTPRAGEEFEMTITFRNTSSTTAVNNVSIRLAEELAGGLGHQTQHAGFSPVAGSDTIFIENLRPLEEVTKVLRYTTSMEATPGVHNMRVDFDYFDQFGNQSTAVNQRITIPVAQIANLEFAHLHIQEWGVQVDMPVWFSLTIINSGRVNLINVRIRVEGNFDVSDAGGVDGEHLGQLNAQRNLIGVDGRFSPFEPGEQTGYIIVTAEDPAGDIVEHRHRFTIFVDGGWGGDWEGGWGEDWEGGFEPGRPVRPGLDPWDDPFGDGEEEVGGFTRFFRTIFTREVEVEPDWWNEEWHGDFNDETNPNRWGVDIETVTRVRWIAAIGIPAVLLFLAVGIPVIIVVRGRRKKLFNDDED